MNHVIQILSMLGFVVGQPFRKKMDPHPKFGSAVD